MAHARIVRHWKQKFAVEGPFIFTRSMQLEEGRCSVGDDVPDYLANDKHRMRMWWKADRIALKNWDYEKGIPLEAPELPYIELGGAWFLFPDGTKAHGKKQLEAKLATLV